MSFSKNCLTNIYSDKACSIDLVKFRQKLLRDIEELDQIFNFVQFDKENLKQYWSQANWENSLGDDYYLTKICGKKDKLQGIFLAKLSKVEDLVHILKVIIVKNLRGQGLGKKLLKNSIDLMQKKGFGKFYLEVDSKNSAAIELYVNVGFKKLVLKRDFYGKGKNAYLSLSEN